LKRICEKGNISHRRAKLQEIFDKVKELEKINNIVRDFDNADVN